MSEKNNTNNCKDCINKLPIFNMLSEEQLLMLDQGRCQVKFRAGETIFKQGTVMTHILIVTDGLVKVYLEGIDNRNLILRIAKPVNMIGGPGFITDFKHHATTMALEDSTACFIDIKVVSDLLQLNKDFALELLKWVNIHTQLNFKKFIELTQKGMHGRISGALLYLYNEVFSERNGEIYIKRQDLADLTSMSKESAIRILKELKDENIISVDGNTIKLIDLKMLAQINDKG